MSTPIHLPIEIITISPHIAFNDDENSLKPIAANSNKALNVKQSNYYREFIEFLLDESLCTIPIFMKYFAFHEFIVLMFGGFYYLQPDVGVICLSIFPGISITAIFIHFFLTQFKKQKVESTFFSMKHYLVALIIFILGLSSIYAIYHTNTYLSTFIPIQLKAESSTSTEIFIGKILQFPHLYAIIKSNDDIDTDTKPFNFRISFVGSIIAPIIEESSKYLLIALTFPIPFIWSFSKKQKNIRHSEYSNYSSYSMQSLFIMFIALCGAVGIAIMENIGYLAACQWEATRPYCLPNKNFDILSAGLARGIFSVPFHCVTACIMADVICMWMNTNILFFHRNKCLYILKFMLSYPISIVIPIFLHSSFNYWMKGMPFVTGIFTIVGFSFLAARIGKKHSFLNDDQETEKENDEYDDNEIDLAVCEPPYVAL